MAALRNGGPTPVQPELAKYMTSPITVMFCFVLFCLGKGKFCENVTEFSLS